VPFGLIWTLCSQTSRRDNNHVFTAPTLISLDTDASRFVGQPFVILAGSPRVKNISIFTHLMSPGIGIRRLCRSGRITTGSPIATASISAANHKQPTLYFRIAQHQRHCRLVVGIYAERI
jgi:hypothetical protein